MLAVSSAKPCTRFDFLTGIIIFFEWVKGRAGMQCQQSDNDKHLSVSVTESDGLPPAEKCAIYEGNVAAKSSLDSTAMAHAEIEQEFENIKDHRVKKTVFLFCCTEKISKRYKYF